MTDTTWLWISFNVFILAMLALDLGVFHRKTHVKVKLPAAADVGPLHLNPAEPEPTYAGSRAAGHSGLDP